jgi:hypothetical protein
MDITKLVAIQNAIREAEGLKNKLGEELNQQVTRIASLQKQLVDICTHPTFTVMSLYSCGGYDYRSQTKYWSECTICKKVIQEGKTEYGYFQ